MAMFWSTVIKPGETESIRCYLDLKVANATLGENADKNERNFLKVTYPVSVTEDNEMVYEDATLCVLRAGVQENCRLGVMFDNQQDIRFSCTGKAPIYLTGYWLTPEFDDSDEEDGEDGDIPYDYSSSEGSSYSEESDEDGDEDGDEDSDEDSDEDGSDSDLSDESMQQLQAYVAEAQAAQKAEKVGQKRAASAPPSQSAPKKLQKTEKGAVEKTPKKGAETPAKKGAQTPSKSKKGAETPGKKKGAETPAKKGETPGKKGAVEKTPKKGAETPGKKKGAETPAKKGAETPGKKKGGDAEPKTPNKPTEAKRQGTPAAVRTLQGGVKAIDLKEGTGKEAKTGTEVTVTYIGRLADGSKKVFDKSKSFKFRIGGGEVIAGWDVGIAGMKIGGKRKLLIPPKMAYGKEGAGSSIPPNAKLEFDVVLLKAK